MSETTRRGFMKMAGAGAIGLGVGPVCHAFSQCLPQMEPVAPHRELKAKRWAMAIDVKKCIREKGCTRCIDACHSVHNVPKHENEKHEVKWIWKDGFEHAFPSQSHEMLPKETREAPVLLLCNHCDKPPCVRVCPTQATWKREEDGIVMMDMHRCIGCRYCMAACPYGSRSFNWVNPRPHIPKIDKDFPTRTTGVVEKCNFCAERLARGKLPACVMACPSKALVFDDLKREGSKVRELLDDRYNIRRKPALGTEPEVFYLI